jgi:hypothetical protein
MSGPVLAIAVTVGVHILGAWALIWAMGIDDLRTFFTTDPGTKGDGGTPPVPEPKRPRGGGGVPLPDAVPARLRLRDEQVRLGDLRPVRPRRPDHVPEREPARERDAR